MWCNQSSLPEDHNYIHFIYVWKHAYEAIKELKKCSPFEVTAILLAALLHDVDDRKLSGSHTKTKTLLIARQLLKESNCEEYTELVCEMISLVATSENGNSCHLPRDQRWKYIPRDCDRLEALGSIGIQRVGMGCYRSGLCFYDEHTPLPVNEEQIQTVLEERPIENYICKGTSLTMMDHFYDKLLHLHVVASDNTYIKRLNSERIRYMKEWVLTVNRVLYLKHIYSEEYTRKQNHLMSDLFQFKQSF